MQRQIARRLSFSSPPPPPPSAFSNRNRGFAETSSPVRISNVQLRKSSVAASAASESSSEAKRTRKKVSKDERRSMVEAFVNKYRATNSGKFPTFKHALKEVGGSYYTVKKLVQELQYESKVSSTSMRKESRKETEVGTINKPPTNFKDVLSSQIPLEGDTCEVNQTTVTPLMENRESVSSKCSSSQKNIEIEISDDYQKGNGAVRDETVWQSEMTETEVHRSDSSVIITSGGTETARKDALSAEVDPVSSCITANPKIDGDAQTSDVRDAYSGDAGDKHLKEDASTSVLEDKTSFNEIGRSSEKGDNSKMIDVKSDLQNQEEELSHLTAEVSEDKIKEKTTTRDVMEVDDVNRRDNQPLQSPELEDTRELAEHQSKNLESPKISFTWKSLKSLADGIINIWRKL